MLNSKLSETMGSSRLGSRLSLTFGNNNPRPRRNNGGGDEDEDEDTRLTQIRRFSDSSTRSCSSQAKRRSKMRVTVPPLTTKSEATCVSPPVSKSKSIQVRRRVQVHLDHPVAMAAQTRAPNFPFPMELTFMQITWLVFSSETRSRFAPTSSTLSTPLYSSRSIVMLSATA
jgi:hypothetical protein